MKKKEFELATTTDMKVFLLFLLDNIGYPLEHGTIIDIVQENTDEISLDYDECLRQLVSSEHLLYDEVDGERYYMISDSGRLIAAELYDRLDPAFREASIRSAAKHISLSRSKATISSKIVELSDKRFELTVGAKDSQGKLFSLTLTVNSRDEADRMVSAYERDPDSIYRGILFCMSGKLEFLS